MNVPDGAVYAALPTLGAAAVWIATSFIKQVAGPRGERGDRGDAGRDAPELTVRDYQLISETLVKELNGRYMIADEARGRFMALEAKMDKHAQEVRMAFARIDPAHYQDRT